MRAVGVPVAVGRRDRVRLGEVRAALGVRVVHAHADLVGRADDRRRPGREDAPRARHVAPDVVLGVVERAVEGPGHDAERTDLPRDEPGARQVGEAVRRRVEQPHEVREEADRADVDGLVPGVREDGAVEPHGVHDGAGPVRIARQQGRAIDRVRMHERGVGHEDPLLADRVGDRADRHAVEPVVVQEGVRERDVVRARAVDHHGGQLKRPRAVLQRRHLQREQVVRAAADVRVDDHLRHGRAQSQAGKNARPGQTEKLPHVPAPS